MEDNKTNGKVCYKCKSVNEEGAKFCKKCGAAFEIVCPQCSTVNGGDTIFCTRCGAQLQSKPTNSKKIALYVGLGLFLVVLIVFGAIFFSAKHNADRDEVVNRNAKVAQEQPKEEEIKTAADEVVNSNANVAQEQPKESVGCKDADGNTYKTVKIGSQVWMAENMRSTTDRNGNRITLGSEGSYTTPYRYYPDGSSSNVFKYGYLYNWAAAMKVCPQGWHLPTDAEWTELENYCSAYYAVGGDKDNIAKALASTKGWEYSEEPYAVGNNPSTNNKTGFSALPAGHCSGSSFGNVGNGAYFWSATLQQQQHRLLPVLEL